MEGNSQLTKKVMRTDSEDNLESANTSVNAATEFGPAELDERMLNALNAASDKKAVDTVILDLRPVANFTDYFIILSGTNVRQVQAISDEIVERLKKKGAKAGRVEGYKAAEWVLLDYGDFIVHIFEGKARRFYDLERLWRDASRVDLPTDLSGAEESSRT